MINPTRWPEQQARTLAARAFREAGVPAGDAEQVADALVDTSLRGIDTHGLRLLPQYLDELATGVAKATATPTVVSDRGAGLLLDADGALGVLAGLAAGRGRRLRGMATLEEVRGTGAGSALLRTVRTNAVLSGADALWCNARTTAAGFYLAQGFRVLGPEYDIPGIGPHVFMYWSAS